jgi:pyruvate/2-oxoglutarate dehydrogenase complex dihydrolipoamide acyltransferase (E2) component
VITAGAGDWGYLHWDTGNEPGDYVGYPASSPNVIAVGGTKLTLTEAGARASETVWNEWSEGIHEEKDVTGGGCSSVFAAPPWQTAVPDWAAVGCGVGAQAKRAVADVAADGAPYTGAAIYDSVPYYYEPGQTIVLGWVTLAGTSLSSPIVASLFALVGGAQGVEHPAATLYSHLGGASLYDVTEGGDGKCDGVYGKGCEGSMSPLSPLDCGEGVLICNAGPGYDGPSGVGAPAGLAAFEAGPESEHAERLAVREAAAKKAEEEQQAAEKKATEERRAAERKAAEERKVVEERRDAEQKAEEERKAAEERLAAEQRAAEERKAEAAKRAAEAKADEEQKVAEATRAVAQRAEEEQQAKRDEEELRKVFEANGLAGAGKGRSSRGGTVRLSHLALTAHASAAIARGLPTLSQVAFAFDLSGPAHVRATLSRLLTAHGRTRWVATTGALTLTAARGRNHTHLRGSATLAPGSYRLTLTPAHGAAVSIVFVLSATTAG